MAHVVHRRCRERLEVGELAFLDGALERVLAELLGDPVNGMHREHRREDAEAGKLRAAAARPASAADPLSQLDRVLDRSHLMPPGAVQSVMKRMKAAGDSEPWPRFVCPRH